MESWNSRSSRKADVAPDDDKRADLTDDDPINARVLALVNDLGLTILTKTRASELHG